MVARNGTRGTTLASLGLLASLIAAGTACSPEALPVPPDYAGEWILSDSVSGLVENELPPMICKTWNRAMHVELIIGDSFYAVQEPYGGVVSCMSDGVFAEPYPLSGQRSFFLEVFADSIVLYPAPGAYQEVSIRYKATTILPDRLAGTVYLPIRGRPDDGLPHGTWELIRSQ